MGYFVKIDTETTKKYEAISPSAFKNFLAFAKGLRFQKLTKIGNSVVKETYYDTPANLLYKSGIVLSKFQEGSTNFFKVENSSRMSKILNKIHKEVFIHQIGANDRLSDHGFYLKDGITSLYSTSFTVDLENVIKTAVPKLVVEVKSEIYQLVSGTGMRGKLALENKFIKNLETKRKYKVQGMTLKIENENLSLFLPDFEEFNKLIQKNCKEFLLVDENQFDFANKVTKALPAKQKLTKEEKQKQKELQKKKNKIQ